MLNQILINLKLIKNNKIKFCKINYKNYKHIIKLYKIKIYY